jgi:uncharacterized protein with von Willebrand factor type A (vWA) domain
MATDVAPTTTVTEMAVAFARVLRGTGLAVPTSTVLAFAEALGVLGLTSRDDVYWAARATLVRNPEDIGVFDRAFGVFWEHAEPVGEPAEEPEPVTITLAVDSDDDDDDGPDVAEPSDDPTVELRFSVSEVLRHKDFAAYDAAELAEAHRVMHRMRLTGSPRRSLRLAPTTRRTNRPDLRRTVRAALRTEGEALRRHYRAPATRHRRLVLLLDVSGSMEPYARALLRFVQAAVAGRRRVEAFALGTRLTRITRELGSRDPDIALRQAAGRVIDWSGGTRLGDGLRRFNDDWGVRGMARGAVVVILSDGWDRGDPEQLAEQMQRLVRVAHRVVWVNPLKVTPGYAPLARGMAAALPYVDRFVEGHSLEAMERLAEVLDEA